MGKKPTTVTNSSSSSSHDDTNLKAVIDNRTRLFESIQADHLARRQTIASQSIKITFPDWSVKEGMQWVMSPMDVAKEISPGLAVSAMNAKVNGISWDITMPLDGGCELMLFKFSDEERKDISQ